jgi:sterol desaturase/sphingolipid hydroxylase (fatty acid hydroxylase superfamily)
MSPSLRSIVVSFLVLLVVFRVLELFRPKDKRLPIWRRGFWTDLVYWAFTPLVTRAVAGAGVAAVATPVAYAIYGVIDHDIVMHGHGPLSRLPLWAQMLGILLLGDLIGYWMHRCFHQSRLWKFHAVHHSSVDLDWLSAVRLHPVNDAVMRIAGTIPILLLGFAPIAVVGVVPILTLMAIMVHANLDWDWGPLRGVITSPRFHRWHHTDETEARDKNFAGLFPAWDMLFGTYFMPKDRRPVTFGTATPVPAGLLGQLAYPFGAGQCDQGRPMALEAQLVAEDVSS